MFEKIHNDLRQFANVHELVYGWEWDKNLECIVFTFYNPRKRLIFQKTIHIFYLEDCQIHDCIIDEIIKEAIGVL